MTNRNRYRPQPIERCYKHDALLRRGDLCMPCLLEQEPTAPINDTRDDGLFDSFIEEEIAQSLCCKT